MPMSQDPEVLRVWRAACDAIRKYMEELRRKVATSAVKRGLSQCHHCGAHIRYGAILLHKPTETYIAVGETCLENRFERATAEFQRLRKAAQLDREAQRIRKAVAEFVEENPDLAFMADGDLTRETTSNDFIQDVAQRLRMYGSISERQTAAVRKALVRDKEREEARANENWVPIPQVGKVTVTGTILSLKWKETQYGATQKMLLKVPHGDGDYKVWVSVPKALHNPEKGDEVSIVGNLEVSDDDPCFGFMSRPRMAS
jgi:hypothetical protein